MPATGVTLLPDLYDCQSPAIGNEAVLEQLFVSALQFAGFEVVDQLTHQSPRQGTMVICLLRQAHASLHAQSEPGRLTADVYVSGDPETARTALEIVRGYLAQKMIARSVNARFVERGAEASAA